MEQRDNYVRDAAGDAPFRRPGASAGAGPPPARPAHPGHGLVNLNRAVRPTGGMTLPYLHYTDSIQDRLSGWQPGAPASIEEKEAEMKAEAERLARIIAGR